jgi:hypothetical protein
MSPKRTFKPGERADRSGQYRQIGRKGGKEPESTVTKGEPLPPTSKPGSKWVLVDPTKHKKRIR